MTVVRTLSFRPHVLELGEELAKNLKMSFSGMVSAFLVRFAMETDARIIETGYAEQVIFSDLARTLRATLERIKVGA